MSSRFSSIPTGPTQPPICRKSIPEALVQAGPPTVLQAWFTVDVDFAFAGQINANQTTYLTQEFPGLQTWRREWHASGYRYEMWYAATSDPTLYRGTVLAINEATNQGGFLFLLPHTPIATEPINSGIQTLVPFAGTGAAAARVML